MMTEVTLATLGIFLKRDRDNMLELRGGTYTNQNVNHSRLDQESQYPDRLPRGSDTDPAFHQELAVFPAGTRGPYRQSRQSTKCFLKTRSKWAHHALRAMTEVAEMLINKENVRKAALLRPIRK